MPFKTDSSMRSDRDHQRESTLYLLVVLDVLTIVTACYAVLYAVSFTIEEPLIFSAYAMPITVITGVVVLCTAAFGLYDRKRSIFSWNALRRLSIAWFVIIASIALLAVVSKTNYTYSRTWFFLSVGVGYLFSLFWRIILNRQALLERSRAAAKLDVLAIGAGDLFDMTVDRLIDNTPYSYKSVLRWVWNDTEGQSLPEQLEALDDFVIEANIEQLWLVDGGLSKQTVSDVLAHFDSELMQISYFPDFSFLPVLSPDIGRQADLPMLTLSATPLHSIDRWFKSLMDRIIAVVVLLVLAPLFIVLALGVKLSSPGPVFYRQERLTLNGKAFNMLKFRSMPVAAEHDSGPVWAKKGEDRATRFGYFLRRTSLDELPQFINVLWGEMSVVGPRPERPFFVEQFQQSVPAYMQKHNVKAGITGWAQINGLRGNTSIEQRIEYDIFYIRNWSIWLDIKIIVLTVFKGLVSDTAY